jgi:hypothetical protein
MGGLLALCMCVWIVSLLVQMGSLISLRIFLKGYVCVLAFKMRFIFVHKKSIYFVKIVTNYIITAFLCANGVPF